MFPWQQIAPIGWRKPCGHSSARIFDQIFFILSVKKNNYKSGQSSNLGEIGPRAAELAALERIENSHRFIMGERLWPLQRIHFSLDLLHSCK